MKNLSAKIVVVLSSLALAGAMVACTNTIQPPEYVDEISVDTESSSSEESEVVSSSSVEEVPSSSEEIESSSSEEAAEPEEEFDPEIGAIEEDLSGTPDKVDDKKDKVVAVTPETIDESMTKVDEDKLPEGIENDNALKGDDLFVGEKDLDFNKNEYYCKTPEGDWYVLEGSKYNSFWAKFLNWMSIIFTGKKWLDYSKVCDVIYVHPNK